MVRREIDVTESLEDWVSEAFGDEANSRSEAYRMALAYGKRQWELEDKRAESE
ncbi:hypothetical protein ACFQO4_20530 [Saliphagus sp. GCM10025334]